jgi:hypothetical protein
MNVATSEVVTSALVLDNEITAIGIQTLNLIADSRPTLGMFIKLNPVDLVLLLVARWQLVSNKIPYRQTKSLSRNNPKRPILPVASAFSDRFPGTTTVFQRCSWSDGIKDC